MKKIITMSLLALAIGASANAKKVSKVRSFTKSKHRSKANSLFSCYGGITSCGTQYFYCEPGQAPLTDAEALEVWDFEDRWACE